MENCGNPLILRSLGERARGDGGVRLTAHRQAGARSDAGVADEAGGEADGAGDPDRQSGACHGGCGDVVGDEQLADLTGLLRVASREEWRRLSLRGARAHAYEALIAAIVVTAGEFTADAGEFASRAEHDLVHGTALALSFGGARADAHGAAHGALICPRCGSYVAARWQSRTQDWAGVLGLRDLSAQSRDPTDE